MNLPISRDELLTKLDRSPTDHRISSESIRAVVGDIYDLLDALSRSDATLARRLTAIEMGKDQPVS